jgi:hypothetical protein
MRARVRPWIRSLAVYLLPLLGVSFGVAGWDYVETRRLTREIESIVARGEPITIYPVGRRPDARKGDNADYMYSAAALLSTAGEAVNESAASPHPLAIHSRFMPVRQWINGTAQRPALADLEIAKRTLESEWHDALSLVDKAAGLPYRGVVPGGESDARISGLFNVSRLLSSRTIGLSVAGEGDAAVDSAISAVQLRRAIRPSQRWLDTTAHEVPVVLSLSRPSESALARLQTTLAREEDPDGPTMDFIETRGSLLNDAWLRFFRRQPGTPLPPAFPVELLPSPQMRPLVTHELVRSLRVWAELLEIARKPWPDRVRLAPEQVARYTNERFRPGGMNGVLAAVSLFRQTLRPDLLVYDRTSRIAVAVERYRRAHAEVLPPALNDLIPNYLDSIPEDPLTGKPLRYRVTADAYTVYSVGPDGKDDGGAQLRQTSPSAATQFPAGADLGIRVLIRQ